MSVQVIRQAHFQFIQDIMTGRSVDPLMTERLLCLANIFLGELSPDELTQIVRLDVF